MNLKKVVVVVAICLASSATLCAQTVLTPHFTEASKKILIPNNDGSEVFPEIHDGLICIRGEGRLLYVSEKTGEYVFGTDANIVASLGLSPYFSGGVKSAVRKGDLVLLYPDGTYRILPKVKDNIGGNFLDASIGDFCEGYALVQRGRSVITGMKQNFVDKNGKDVFPALTSVHKGTFGNMKVYPLRDNRRVFFDAETRKYGYADEKGNIIVKAQYGKALDFSEGLAAVAVIEDESAWTPTYRWGFIDVTGKMVIPATYYLKPGRFSEGLAVVRIGKEERRYELTYIDKTGKRMMEPQAWYANEFHNGLAWVSIGCDELFLIDKEFKKVIDLAPTKEFYICDFNVESGAYPDEVWGFDFPNGMKKINGRICAPDGTILYKAIQTGYYGGIKALHYTPGSDLFFCQISIVNVDGMKDAPPVKNFSGACFINTKGEIVYYFDKVFEGFEGPAPVEIK